MILSLQCAILLVGFTALLLARVADKANQQVRTRAIKLGIKRTTVDGREYFTDADAVTLAAHLRTQRRRENGINQL